MRKIVATIFAVVLGLAGCGDDSDDEIAVDEPAAIVDDDDFDTLDANGDSYLDGDEIAEWADDTGAFNEWDIDGDSELDRDEITGNAFELWDADDNGSVSEQEWEDGAELWYPDDAETVVFSDLDGDGDSELDGDEFAESVDLTPIGESWNADSFDAENFETAYFELYDRDADGKVTETEWTDGAAMVGSPKE